MVYARYAMLASYAGVLCYARARSQRDHRIVVVVVVVASAMLPHHLAHSRFCMLVLALAAARVFMCVCCVYASSCSRLCAREERATACDVRCAIGVSS